MQTIDLYLRPNHYRRVPAPAPCLSVSSRSAGIGDHLMTVCLAEGLRRQHPGATVLLACARWVHPWVGLFWDAITDARPAGLTHLCEHSTNHPIFTARGLSRWQFWEEELGVQAVLPALRPLPAAATEAARELAGRVVLSPFADWADRTWPLDRWLEVERLLIAAGYECVVIDGGKGDTSAFTSRRWIDRAAAEVAALVRAAICLVGNDSGMAHLAGMVGTTAVAVCSATSDPNIFDLYPTVRSLGGRQTGFDTVTPADVLAAVDAAVCRRARERSLLTPAKYAALRRLAREVADVPGAIAELGTFRGGGALAMADALPGRRVHIFDTFEGLPGDDKPIGGKLHAGEFRSSIAEVDALLADHDTRIHVGLFPATTVGLEDERYALVHLDGDLYESTRAGIAYFWPRINPGGVLIFDDWSPCDVPGVEKAVREAFGPDQIEDTARNQCVVRKPHPTPAYAPPCVVTAWDAGYSDLAAVTWPRLASYAGRHGYAAVRAPVQPGRPASWSKLPALLDALARHPLALWIDADAAVTGDADLAELLGDADVAIAEDDNGPNCGVLILRSVPWVLDVLRGAWDAFPQYAEHRWYEQPALVERLWRRWDRVRVLPQRALNAYPFGPDPWRPGDFILHCPGRPIAERLAALSQ